MILEARIYSIKTDKNGYTAGDTMSDSNGATEKALAPVLPIFNDPKETSALAARATTARGVKTLQEQILEASIGKSSPFDPYAKKPIRENVVPVDPIINSPEQVESLARGMMEARRKK